MHRYLYRLNGATGRTYIRGDGRMLHINTYNMYIYIVPPCPLKLIFPTI
jgi:hypothetical protein